MLQTFEGVVHRGNVRLSADVDLPDGTRVYVTIIPPLEERLARRKAAIWLAENVGDMVMPGSPTLIHQDNRSRWRFPALVGSPFDEPGNPIGHVDVDAETGTVLATPALVQELIHNAEHPSSPTLPSGS